MVARHKRCPACGQLRLSREDVRNSYSRYVDVYICSPCGMQEATSGFFWKQRARITHADKIKPAFKG